MAIYSNRHSPTNEENEQKIMNNMKDFIEPTAISFHSPIQFDELWRTYAHTHNRRNGQTNGTRSEREELERQQQ